MKEEIKLIAAILNKRKELQRIYDGSVNVSEKDIAEEVNALEKILSKLATKVIEKPKGEMSEVKDFNENPIIDVSGQTIDIRKVIYVSEVNSFCIYIIYLAKEVYVEVAENGENMSRQEFVDLWRSFNS